MSRNMTQTSFIPLRSRGRAQRPRATRFRIGAVCLEESGIEFWERQGTYKDCSHKGQRFHVF